MKKQFIISPDMEGYKPMSEYLGSIIDNGEYVTITVEPGKQKKRSLSVNGLQHAWHSEVSEWSGHTEQYVKNHDKLEFGLPILRAGDNEEARVINWTLAKIGFDTLSPKRQMNVLSQFSITSILTPDQHREYRDKVQQFYADAGLVLVVR